MALFNSKLFNPNLFNTDYVAPSAAAVSVGVYKPRRKPKRRRYPLTTQAVAVSELAVPLSLTGQLLCDLLLERLLVEGYVTAETLLQLKESLALTGELGKEKTVKSMLVAGLQIPVAVQAVATSTLLRRLEEHVQAIGKVDVKELVNAIIEDNDDFLAYHLEGSPELKRVWKKLLTLESLEDD